jgi:hypothetical protein
MNNIISSLNFNRYISPVYSPIQSSSFFTEDCTGSTQYYSATILFNLTAITGNNNYFIINDVKFEISTSPTQNQIPEPSILTNNSDFIYFVEEAIQNNPIFDSYQLTTSYDAINEGAYITLTNRIRFTNEVLTITSNTPFYIFKYDEQLIDFCYYAQQLNNYSLWVDVYSNNNKNLFNWDTITGVTNDGLANRLQGSLYKTFQPHNQYIFNLEPILQSVSRTTLPLIDYGSTVFQQDTNSLNNLRLEFFESYDVELGGVTSIRKFPMTVNGQDAIENKWYWDAARNLTFQETKPYYYLDTQYIDLTTVQISGSTQLLFKYQLDIGETITCEDSFQTVVFTASTYNDGDKVFKIEQQLTGTVENFLTVFIPYFTQFNVSYTGYGYSQVRLDINNDFSNAGLDLLTTGSSNGHIIRTNFIPSSEENIISIQYPEEEGINVDTEIKFLTDRPRQDTALKYNLAQFNTTGLTYKQNTLSLFIAPYENISPELPIELQGFFVRTKYYQNNEWSDTWSDSIFYPWLFNQGDLQGTDNGLYHVDLDPRRWSADTNTEKIKFAIGWYISKTESDIDYIRNYSEEFQYDIDLVCDYEIVKPFMFLNDLGGWDYYDFIEDLIIDYNRDTTLIATDGSGLTTLATTYEQMFQNSIEESYKVKTIVNSQAEYDWLYQLVKSSRVYYIETNNNNSRSADYYQQVIIINTDFQQTENTNQWVLNIEYRIAQKDKSQKSI